MPVMPPTFRSRVQPSKAERSRETDERRGSARSRGYTTAWDRAAKGHLAHHPLCAYCALADQTVAATLVDHLYPHRGDQQLFWSKLFWVSSCADCHNSFKQRLERLGRMALDDLARRLGLPTLAEVQRGGGG